MIYLMSDVSFEVCGSDHVYKQRVKLKPVEHHYEDGERKCIKYSCRLCESLSKAYPNKMMDADNRFEGFSFARGTEQCPCCGVYVDWEENN